MDLTKLIFKREQFRLALANVTERFNDTYRFNHGCETCEAMCAGGCDGCCHNACTDECTGGCSGSCEGVAED